MRPSRGCRAAAALLAVASAACAVEPPAATPSAARGLKLFNGEVEIAARIAGQDFSLTAQSSRCVNCHALVPRSNAASAAPVQRIGPALTPALLTTATRRRGGPPSRYDATSLCKLLRTGVDPAHVVVLRTMPRYEIVDADCLSLWLQLNAEP